MVQNHDMKIKGQVKNSFFTHSKAVQKRKDVGYAMVVKKRNGQDTYQQGVQSIN